MKIIIEKKEGKITCSIDQVGNDPKSDAYDLLRLLENQYQVGMNKLETEQSVNIFQAALVSFAENIHMSVYYPM